MGYQMGSPYRKDNLERPYVPAPVRNHLVLKPAPKASK